MLLLGEGGDDENIQDSGADPNYCLAKGKQVMKLWASLDATLIYCHYATIIAQSAFAALDGESRLKHRGDKKLYDSIPPLPSSAAATTAQARSAKAAWTGTR